MKLEDGNATASKQSCTIPGIVFRTMTPPAMTPLTAPRILRGNEQRECNLYSGVRIICGGSSAVTVIACSFSLATMPTGEYHSHPRGMAPIVADAFHRK